MLSFELVQELLKQDTRISPAKEALYPLAGLIYCGDCMESMVRKTVPAGGMSAGISVFGM